MRVQCMMPCSDMELCGCKSSSIVSSARTHTIMRMPELAACNSVVLQLQSALLAATGSKQEPAVAAAQ